MVAAIGGYRVDKTSNKNDFSDYVFDFCSKLLDRISDIWNENPSKAGSSLDADSVTSFSDVSDCDCCHHFFDPGAHSTRDPEIDPKRDN